MEVGLVLFLIDLHNVLSDPYYSNGISHWHSPKKNFQIIIGREFEHPKKRVNPNGYTVFPPMGDSGFYDIPDSPYFTDLAQKKNHRVKKVLPDYPFSELLRSKRSAVAPKKDEPIKAINLKKQVKADNKTAVVATRNGTKISRKLSKDHKKLHKRKLHKKSKGQKRRPRLNGIKMKPGKKLKNDKLHAKRNMDKRQTSHKKNRRNLKKKNGKAEQKKAQLSRRLIAARDASIENYPYVVSIQKDDEHWCSGAILNPRLVITTANCIWKSTHASRMQIRAGSRNANSGGQIAKIQEVRKHPDWSIRKGPDNDIGLLLLDRNLKFSDSVHGVDLPNRVMMPVFEDAWVTSWGADRRDGVYDKKEMTPQSIHARLMDRSKCNNITQRYGVQVTENFICLSQLGQRAPCTRDTGAPAVSDGVLWGLASWGIRKLCGTQRFPAMFSYVASHSNMDFIMNATRSLMADERHYPLLDRHQD